MWTNQIQGLVERVLTMAFMYAVGKGWIASGDVAPLVALVVAALPVIWSVYINSPKRLAVAAAGSNPEVIMVSPKALADGTPSSPNIVSDADVKVVQK